MGISNGYQPEPDERTPDQEALVRRELIDHLVALGRCDEAVQAQRAFLDWARRALPQDRLLWVMSDATQALCWVAVGRHEEWLAIFRELLGSLIRRSTNRIERLDYLRTAGLVLIRLGRRDEALRVVGMIRDLAKEDPGWERALWPLLEARVLELGIRQASGDRATLRREAAAVATLLDEQYRLLERGGQPVVEPARLNELLAYVRGMLRQDQE
jgi:tetratricopeptide (TPR) repeat protein